MTAPQPRFGRYEVTRTLGSGDTGTVYRAFDHESRREVALKALAPELNSQPAAHDAFLAGARAAQALRHPNLVPVYDFGDAEGRPFFTMELIRGRTLAEVLADEPRLPFGRLVEIFRGVCSAADYLHRGGRAHGRISPTTVMVKDSGRAVLLEPDFSGESATPADDLQALGLMAGLLIAGSRFQATPTEAALRELQPELPETTYQTVAAALSVDPAARPRSAGEIAVAAAAASPVITGRESSTATLAALPEKRPAPRVIEPARTGPQDALPERQPEPSTPPLIIAAPVSARPVPPEVAAAAPAPSLGAEPLRGASTAPPSAPGKQARGRRWVPAVIAVLVVAALLGGVAVLRGGGGKGRPAATTAGTAATPARAAATIPTATQTPAATVAPALTVAPLAPSTAAPSAVRSVTTAATPTATAAAPTPNSPPSTTPIVPTATTPAGAAPPTPDQRGTQEIMLDNRFMPAELVESAGKPLTIVLVNRGNVPHNFHVTSLNADDGREIKTDLLDAGQSGSVTFTISAKGFYSYRCDVHPDEMRGVLTVQ